MADQTGIVNAALTLLGSRTFIASLDDSKPTAQHAKAAWEPALQLLLASHPWNFTIARARLNAGDPPEFGYAYGYTLPADCLRWLPPSEDDDDWFEAEQEGNRLLSDAEAPLPVRYISRNLADDMTRWSPHFAEAMTLEIAARMAEAITQSETIKQDMDAKAREALKVAKRMDGLATGRRTARKVTAKSNWLAARRRPYQFAGR